MVPSQEQSDPHKNNRAQCIPKWSTGSCTLSASGHEQEAWWEDPEDLCGTKGLNLTLTHEATPGLLLVLVFFIRYSKFPKY